eukprot:CAMPEP_0198291350 /NCGR_PEP_ID=MMETSP1449-20131203/8908_1 /TAXON_ID=420275 /ORGANISM="Attheya septentrionalis, Strain CCMP2084" /LENGTH=254 /DNA_ID=CAMNT_0043989977 /DNA_START=38 /DNA_END=799 /DNA_ORIENTATION=+
MAQAATSKSASLTAAVIGATGAVGKEIVHHLVKRDAWSKVIVLNRREVSYESSKVEQHIVSMDDETNLEETCKTLLSNTDALFVTMGVGAPSKGDEETLKRVDVTMPSACARGAKTAGVQHVSILSAFGANINAKPAGFFSSKIMPKTAAGGPLYNKCKGTVEQNMTSLHFPKSVSIFRPAALIGTPSTPGYVASLSKPLDLIVPIQFKSSDINTLAAAMVFDSENKLTSSDTSSDEAHIFEGKKLHDLYKSVP